ncbi:MAG: hypothetical protein JST26_09610 [Bacteroidetes bacterium]|nr:hypothetical protein [Bacteroidota bacterium]
MKPKSKANMGISNLTPGGKAIKAQAIIDAMQASGNFPAANMPISYPALQALITNLHNAIVQADNGNSADTSDMHEQERVLVMAFNLVKAHVEMVSNTFTNPDTVILSAGMSVAAGNGQGAITDLTLDAIGNGTVRIRVPRSPENKSFLYQYALASDPTNWQNIGYSTLSRMDLKNQNPGVQLLVRYAAISKQGISEFSSPKQIMVI